MFLKSYRYFIVTNNLTKYLIKPFKTKLKVCVMICYATIPHDKFKTYDSERSAGKQSEL